MIKTDWLLNVGGAGRRRLPALSVFTCRQCLSPEVNLGSGSGPQPTALSRGRTAAMV